MAEKDQLLVLLDTAISNALIHGEKYSALRRKLEKAVEAKKDLWQKSSVGIIRTVYSLYEYLGYGQNGFGTPDQKLRTLIASMFRRNSVTREDWKAAIEEVRGFFSDGAPSEEVIKGRVSERGGYLLETPDPFWEPLFRLYTQKLSKSSGFREILINSVALDFVQATIPHDAHFAPLQQFMLLCFIELYCLEFPPTFSPYRTIKAYLTALSKGPHQLNLRPLLEQADLKINSRDMLDSEVISLATFGYPDWGSPDPTQSSKASPIYAITADTKEDILARAQLLQFARFALAGLEEKADASWPLPTSRFSPGTIGLVTSLEDPIKIEELDLTKDVPYEFPPNVLG